MVIRVFSAYQTDNILEIFERREITMSIEKFQVGKGTLSPPASVHSDL